MPRSHTCPYMLKLSNLHSHLHSCSLHRKKIGCALFQSQSTFISAVNVNWRAVLRKQKTHFLKLTRFHRFGCFPFSLVFSGSFLLFDKRWVFPVLSLQALMGKVCAWHCVVFRQRKCVLLCAILLSTCGNEEQGGKKQHTFDRQEWYYDILMCSTAGKYSLCLHFLFWRFWHFLGIAMFCFFSFLLKRDFLLSSFPIFGVPILTLTEQIGSRMQSCYQSCFLLHIHILYHSLVSITLSIHLPI